MIKDRNLYKYQKEWFRGYDNKLYKIIVNNLFKVGIIDLLRIKDLSKNRKRKNYNSSGARIGKYPFVCSCRLPHLPSC